jgi:hypothetical protein
MTKLNASPDSDSFEAPAMTDLERAINEAAARRQGKPQAPEPAPSHLSLVPPLPAPGLFTTFAPPAGVPAGPSFRKTARGIEYRRSCPGCGEPLWMLRTATTDRCPPCAKVEMGARHRHIQGAALGLVPAKFAGMRFGEALLKKACPSDPARLAARSASSAAKVILIAGGTGRGKTSLAAAIYRAQVDRLDRPEASQSDEFWVGMLCWADAVAIAVARKESKLGAVPELLDRAQRASLLVIDDLGQEAAADKQALVELISFREAHERPTVITFGFAPSKIETTYGDHVMRRLTEGKTVIDLGGGKAEAVTL